MAANPEADTRKKKIEEASNALVGQLSTLCNDFFSGTPAVRQCTQEEVVKYVEQYYDKLDKLAESKKGSNLELAANALESRRPRDENFYQLCAMIYYADQQFAPRRPKLSEKLIENGVATCEQLQGLVKQSLCWTDSDSHLEPEGDDDYYCRWGQGKDVPTSMLESFYETIDEMPTPVKLGAAFVIFAFGALQVTASILLTILLAGSVIPSFGLTTPLAIGGCALAGVGFASGVTLMAAGIKLGMNAFSLFSSSSADEGKRRNGENCFSGLFL